MRETIQLATDREQQLVDLTHQVQDLAARSGIRNGIVHVYAQGEYSGPIRPPIPIESGH